MPRRSNAEAAQTRASIIDRAVQTASIEGLEGVTIGRLVPLWIGKRLGCGDAHYQEQGRYFYKF